MRRQIRMNASALALSIGLAWSAQAANFTVSNLQDSGAGSLREAINLANANGEADTITFSVSGTIAPIVPLPSIRTQVTIDGSGQTVMLSGSNALRPVSVASGGALTLQYITVANGRSADDSAGILNYGDLIVRNCSFINNSGDTGGAIVNFDGTLTISDSTFSGNSVVSSGGAVYSVAKTPLKISGSTFFNNSATGGGGLRVTGSGGASVINSTFSGNTAQGSGGAIQNGTTLTLSNVTISGNSATLGAGIRNDSSSTLNVGNTIIADNSGGDCWNLGSINAPAVNLVKDGSCAIQGALSGDPGLGPLADNGGPTQTHALLTGSPAIDTGNDTICANPVNNRDQRGEIRPSGPHCDLGAFELQQAPKFAFTGFLAPVNNPPTVNAIKAGQSLPVKFSLAGNQGLSIFAPDYPQSQPMGCVSGAALDEVETTVSAGGSTLSYDSATDTYTYVWKTDKAWKGCRQLIVQLSDGTVHTANFQFR